MALYNTSSDVANTAVRAFLTKIGELYLRRSFNVASGVAQKDWQRIRDVVFEGTCAYCGKKEGRLQMDHLIMFNRTGYGLHHPGNIAPVCKKCNTRSKNANGEYNSWEDHLTYICESSNEKNEFMDRFNRIRKHTTEGEYAYPTLTDEEKNTLRIITSALYRNIKGEFENAIELYKELGKPIMKPK